MEEKYVISIKANKDILGKDCEEWRYAGIDNGFYGSGYPCWLFSDKGCINFNNINDAEKWFSEAKTFLLDSHYASYNLDIDSLGIRKVIYKKIKSLN